MSLSIGSSSSEDNFTSDQPQITDEEVNGSSITSWTIITENPTETGSSAQQQQQRQQMMSMLALCHGESKQQKFKSQIKKMTIDEEMKQQKVMAQHILLLEEKVAKMEQEKEQQKKRNEKYVSADQFAALLARVIELEEEQKQQKVKEKGTATTTEKHGSVDQSIKIRNEHFLKRISELEKQQLKQQKQQDENYDNEYASEQFTDNQLQNDQQQKIVGESSGLKKRQQKVFSNYWDANFCHNDLEIIGNECLTVRHNGDIIHGYRSVCAKYPIFYDQNDYANSFYFEISIKKTKKCAAFGFIAQKQMALDEYICARDGTYTWQSNGILWKNGSHTLCTDKRCKYGAGDTVGCGIDLAKRKIYFTKNGIRLDSDDLRIYFSISSDVGQLFPFISLCDFDDKIETNFGPNFMAIIPKTFKSVPINHRIVSRTPTMNKDTFSENLPK
ncbi:hypothetical protein niasHT_004517 [Heterodera trifolii]|uniref:B30.2/SPRY domain-containing protein n=1 Tax=Heterodera trifolii TaxID=157864 RepID=A0ABD2M061_9BILA